MRESSWHGLAAFRGRPVRALLPVAAVVVVFCVIASWNIGNAGFSDFYSTAAKSMSVSWRAFFYGSFDPSATITLDKLSGFLVPQALSARLFGFHAWSIALPQVVEGGITILASYVIAARWRGWAAGMVALVATASTPLLVSMFGHVMEDGLLTMSLALALLCWQSWLLGGRMTPLVFSALWIAVGFQAKMMQAWFILPALVIGILIAGRVPVPARIRAAAIFVGVAIAGSVLWMTVVQLIPAGARPYIDGSTNNNVFSMVFGYNGFNRLVPNLVPGAAPDFIGRVFGHTGAGASSAKLLLPAYTTQIGWLYPLVVAGIVLLVVRLVRSGRRPDGETVFGVATTVWLATAAVILSVAAIPHTAYLAAIGIQVGLLAAFACVELFRMWRSARLRGRLLVALVVATEAGWTAAILVMTRIAPLWILVVVGAAGIGAVLTIVVRLPGFPSRRRVSALVLLAGLAVFIAPLTWTGSTLDPVLGGTANDAYAGPHLTGSPRFFRPRGSAAAVTSLSEFEIGAPVLTGRDPRLTRAERTVVDYVEARNKPGGLLLATTSWKTSEQYILGGGYPVLSVGGFSGSIPSPTLTQLRSLIAHGRLRFVLVSPGGFGRTSPTERSITSWVTSTCHPAPLHSQGDQLSRSGLWDCGP